MWRGFAFFNMAPRRNNSSWSPTTGLAGPDCVYKRSCVFPKLTQPKKHPYYPQTTRIFPPRVPVLHGQNLPINGYVCLFAWWVMVRSWVGLFAFKGCFHEDSNRTPKKNTMFNIKKQCASMAKLRVRVYGVFLCHVVYLTQSESSLSAHLIQRSSNSCHLSSSNGFLVIVRPRVVVNSSLKDSTIWGFQ